MTSLPVDPRTAPLRAYLAGLVSSLDDLSDAIGAVNDPEWRDAFEASITTGKAVAGFHAQVVHPSIADDLVSVRSQFARHMVPREDPQLGPLESLKRIRAARGSVLAEIDEMLAAAADLGVKPSAPMIELPPATEFERAGFEMLFDDLAKRLRAVEDGLKQVEAEGRPETASDVRQRGLVNFYVGNMNVELALAKVETSIKAVVDFASLGRAIEVMGELTRDFVGTVNGMSRVLSEGLKAAAKDISPKVRSLSTGLRAIVRKVAATRKKGPALPRIEREEAGETAASALSDERFWELVDAGDAARTAGKLGEARVQFEAARDEAERLLSTDPGNTEWQRNLSVGHNRIGDVALAAGDLAAARRAYEAGLAIVHRLAASDLGNAEWQRDLSVSHNKIGDVTQAAGDLPAARSAYEAGLAIRLRMAAIDPGNAEWQRDLSVSNNRIGDIARAAGDLVAARSAYEADLDIAQRLAASDPSNAEWQRDLSVSHEKIGDVARAAGDLAAARIAYEADLAIAERLAASDPDNAGWQRDLLISNCKLGQLALQESNPTLALTHFRAAEAVMAALAARWPDHPGFARDLQVVRDSIAHVEGAGEG